MLADMMDDQLKSMWFSPFQAEEIDTDLDMVKGFINITEMDLKMRVNLSLYHQKFIWPSSLFS